MRLFAIEKVRTDRLHGIRVLALTMKGDARCCIIILDNVLHGFIKRSENTRLWMQGKIP